MLYTQSKNNSLLKFSIKKGASRSQRLKTQTPQSPNQNYIKGVFTLIQSEFAVFSVV